MQAVALAEGPVRDPFISEDPIGFAGRDVNLYAYVAGNPVLYRDPLGLVSVNLFPRQGDLATGKWADKYNPTNWFTVGGHGGGPVPQGGPPEWREISPKAMARMIRDKGWQPGQTVRFMLCSFGNPDSQATEYVQELANELQTTVEAPTEKVWWFPDRDPFVAPPNPANTGRPHPTQRGTWVPFHPQR